jgi:hypothetical protein
MMSWKDEFQEAIIRFLVKESTPVGEGDTRWGWIADDYQELGRHLETCSLHIPECSWADSDWTEFAGTFADPPWDERKGIDVKVTCSCGRVKGRTWRYRGSSGDLLRAITDE